MKFTHWLIALLALCATHATSAQKVYRCGPDGRIYQQTPCAEGKAVDASDPRTAEQRQAAQAVAKSEAKAASRLDAEAASAAKSGKARPAEPRPAKVAGGAKTSSEKAEPPPKPQAYLVPKSAASAAKP